MKDIAAGGGRWLETAPDRFPRWIAGFAERHGAGSPGSALTVAVTSDGVTFTAPDGTIAKCRPPFWESLSPGTLPGDAEGAVRAIKAHALAERAVGVLLVRLGGYAAGVFTGSPPVLADHKTGARPVHGRSAAGGWSQRRFARRRAKQASEALRSAAGAAAEVFGRWADGTIRSGEESAAARAARPAGTRRPGLDVVVFGGDKRAVAEVCGDPRLAPYAELATERFLTVPDPRLAVLKDAPRLFLAVRIFLTEPAA